MIETIDIPRDELLFSLTRGLAQKDVFTRSWLAQVVLRMRRELCWAWRNHEPADRLVELLQRQSFEEERRRFFIEDVTARYLEEEMRATRMPLRSRSTTRGTIAWLASELQLTRAEIFVVTLAFAAALDPEWGSLIAALQGDMRKQLPDIALAQRLWDEPHALASLASPSHALFARGILRRPEAAQESSTTFFMPVPVAWILEGRRRQLPPELECIAQPMDGEAAEASRDDKKSSDIEIELLAGRMAQAPQALSVVPVSVPFAGDWLDARSAMPALSRIANLTGRPVYSIRSSVAISIETLESAAIYCWMRGADLMLPSMGMPNGFSWQNALRAIPIYVFIAAKEDGAALQVNTLPTLKIPMLSYVERRQSWVSELGRQRLEADSEAIRECAYRFRFDHATIVDTVDLLARSKAALTVDLMIAACQQQVGTLIGAQARLVSPRFKRDELVLDAERSIQFDQLISAMRNLSRVHAEWGFGRALGESGISAMFAGAPGTGKTMAAEVLASELRLPMYHVDLSQVVNKYIGETEKNLRKLFDAAEQADIILFFDEADALFGQRTETRSSNDRFANMEISYLLERMDRFRGLAILATNNKDRLDAAFLRRLRFVINFPLPGEAERLMLWKKSIPAQISVEGIDFSFLAHEFALAGGNIRSIVFNACLQTASANQKPALNMTTMMTAVDREYEKIGRPLTREQKLQWQLTPPPVSTRSVQ